MKHAWGINKWLQVAGLKISRTDHFLSKGKCEIITEHCVSEIRWGKCFCRIGSNGRLL